MFCKVLFITILFGVLLPFGVIYSADEPIGTCYCDVSDINKGVNTVGDVTPLNKKECDVGQKAVLDEVTNLPILIYTKCKWVDSSTGTCICTYENFVANIGYTGPINSNQVGCVDKPASNPPLPDEFESFTGCKWMPPPKPGFGCYCDVAWTSGKIYKSGFKTPLNDSVCSKGMVFPLFKWTSCQWKGQKPAGTAPGSDPGGGVGGSSGVSGSFAPPAPTGPTASLEELLKTVKLENPLPTTDLRVLLGQIIAKVMGIVGALVLLVFLYGGFMWLTAAGNPEHVKKGTQAMLWAAVGLFIVFASYGMLSLVFKAMGTAGGGYNPWGVEGYTKSDVVRATEGCYCKETTPADPIAGTSEYTSPTQILQPEKIDKNECLKTGAQNSLGKILVNCEWKTFVSTPETK